MTYTGTKSAEQKCGEGEQDKSTKLATTFVPEGPGVILPKHRGRLLRSLIDEIVDTKLEIRSVKLFRQRWKLPDTGDGSPGCAIERLILCRTIEVH